MDQRFASLMTDLFALIDADETECFDEGVALIAVAGFDISLTLLEGADQILISTVVAEFPADGRAELLAKLLEGNLFFQKTQGFTLAAREDTGVMLQAALPCAILDKSALASAVVNLVSVADYWRDVCEGTLDDDEPAEEELSFGAGLDMIRV